MLLQCLLASPGVVHTVVSPTSFRAEYRRAGSGSSLLARPVKLQVDLIRASTGPSAVAFNLPPERELYAVNFQLLSDLITPSLSIAGPTRRFKRLCEQLQAALLTTSATKPSNGS
ncbi:Serine/threonine-protein kinase brsk1, partial [Cichlidogyrus casuarinus]